MTFLSIDPACPSSLFPHLLHGPQRSSKSTTGRGDPKEKRVLAVRVSINPWVEPNGTLGYLPPIRVWL